VQQIDEEATEQVYQNVVGLEECLVSAVEAHEELAAMVSRLAPLETMLGKLQDQVQEQTERVGQLERELLT
jgi:vacuolar-type H+-ATPase subunit D/Vma8